MDGLHGSKIRLRWVVVLTLQAQACTGLVEGSEKASDALIRNAGRTDRYSGAPVIGDRKP